MSLLSRVLHHADKTPRPTVSTRRSPVSLHIQLESPPVVLYGNPSESTGSIISGVLTLRVHARSRLGSLSVRLDSLTRVRRRADSRENGRESGPESPAEALTPTPSSSSATDSEVEVDSVVLLLVQTVHYTRPFLAPGSMLLCKDCATRTNTLAQWDVLLQQAGFASGLHAYPFSHLLPGLVTASCKLGGASSGSYVKYELVAVAHAGSHRVQALLPLDILRLIVRGPDRNSLRIFPPTEMTASAVLPGVMYPKLTFPIELRLDHVVSSSQDRRWRMRKLVWKIEEHTQVRGSACPHHQAKLAQLEDTQRRTQQAKALRGTAQGPSRSLGMHHLTVQTLMYVGPDPGAVETGPSHAGDQDVVEPVDDGPSNRVGDEAIHFEEDFGGAASNAAEATASTTSTAPSVDSLYLDELRVIAHGEIKLGWKSDFLGSGRIELVAEISALQCLSGPRSHPMRASSADTPPDEASTGLRNGANISCDVLDPTLGVFVSHVLVIEVVVAEEVASKVPPPELGLTPVALATLVSSTHLVGVPTGAARVLRMQFKLAVLERLGLGIAWDDEVPPTYEDVRALSPPNYDASPFLPFPRNVLYGVGATPNLVADLDDGIQELTL